MKKILCYIVSLCILVPILLTNTQAKSYKSAKEAIDDANDFLLRKMGYENYYSLQINGMNINDNLPNLVQMLSQTDQYLYMVIV